MCRIFSSCLLIFFLAGSVFAQKSKSWTEWSKKEAEKILNDSAWGQTQIEGGSSQSSDTSAITQVAAPRAADSQLNRKGESGESKPSKLVKYHVRFLTAKPIREAFARMVILAQANPNEALTQQLQGFVDRDFGDYIVVTISAEAVDQRFAGAVVQAFVGATAESLKSNVYLERKDGKRLLLMDYRPPNNDGMGAKFVFRRVVDGQPFLKAENEQVRFVADVTKTIKLNMRYKLSEMIYEGKLEY